MRLCITGAALQAQALLNAVPVGPSAFPDTATSLSGQTIQIYVLANDTHPDEGEILTLTAVSVDPAKGTATIEAAGVIEFTGAVGVSGDAVISYTVEDESGVESSSSVTVTVTLNNPPTANPGTSTMAEDGATITIDVLANDTHPDDDDLTVISASVNELVGTVSVVSNQVEFTPTEHFNGDATITYTIEDENGDQDTSTHVVTVTPVDDDPVAVDDTDTTEEETPVTIDVLANDTHPDSDTLTIQSASVDPGEGTVSIVSNEIVFTPAAAFTGTATITYVVEDENTDTDTGTVTVTVTASGGGGGDVFDDATSPAIEVMRNGSTSGVGKTNCDLWSNKAGIDNSSDACEWRTQGGTREEVDLRVADDPSAVDYWVRCRFKVTTAGTAKQYVQFSNEFMDAYEAWFDVTDDATADAARVMSTSANISDATASKHATNGFIYVKFRLNFSTASDTNGTNTLNMSDTWNGDGEMDVSSQTVIATQDYTFEAVA